MKKIFFKPLSIGLYTLLFCMPNLSADKKLASEKLIIWAKIDQKINNQKTINELYDFLEKNHPEMTKKIKIDDVEKPHMLITITGIIYEKNGKKYVISKNEKQVPLEDIIKAVEKAILETKIINKKELNFNVKLGSRFSDPTNKDQYYIKQIPSLEKHHPLHILGKAITKELSKIGLSPSEFRPNVNSTRIHSDNKKTLGKLIYFQNRHNFFKILKAVPGQTGLTCSNIEIVIDKGNSYDILKTYDLK